MQFNIKMAELNIEINCRLDSTKLFCKEYLTEDTECDFSVAPTSEEIKKEISLIEGTTETAAEQLCVYRNIANNLPLYNRFVFHGAAITYEDKGILFTAPSGTGKTTHIKLWKKNFANSVRIVNGDKPILKVEEEVTVYGTPWAGKEQYQRNRKAPLKAICVIKRGTDNSVKRISASEAVSYLMQQIYLPKEPQALSKTLALLNKLLESVPCFVASVDMSNSAAQATFKALIK